MFKCWRRNNYNASYAVKRIDLPKLKMRTNETRLKQRLAREISILQRLDANPNVVGYEGCYDDQGGEVLYIVQEYIPGGELLGQVGGVAETLVLGQVGGELVGRRARSRVAKFTVLNPNRVG